MAGRELRDDRGGKALTSTTATTSTANSNTTTTTTTSTAASLDEITVASPASGEGLGSRPERAAAQLCQLKLKYEYAPQSPSKRRADTVEQAPCSPSVETLLSATVRRVELEVAKELGGPSDCKKARDERSSPTTTTATTTTTTTAADGRERESAGSAKKLLNNGSDRRSCDGLTSSGSKARKEAAATDSPISSPVTRSQTLDEDATSPRESKQREVTVKCNGTISTKSPISNMLNKLVVVVPKVVVTKMSANCDTNTGTGALVNAKSVSLKAGVANTNINNNNNNNNNHNNNKNMLASEMDERDEKQPKASTKVPPSRLKAADSTSTDVDTSIANNGTSCAKSPKAVGSSRRDGSSESDGSTERTPIKLCRARTDPASLTPTATSNGYGGSSKIEHYNAVTTTTTAPASAELSTPKMTRTMAVNARKLDAGDESVVVVSELISKNDSSSSKGGNDGQGLGGAAAETTLATPTMLTTTTTTTTAWSASTSVTTIAAPTITITTTTTLGPTIAKTTTATTATTTTIATPTAAAAAAAAATGTLLTAPTRTTTYSSGGNISSCTPTSAKMRTGRELSAEDVLESTPKKAICGPSAATVRRKDLDTPVLSPVMKDIPENPSSPMTRSMSRRMEETVPGALDSGVGRYMQSNSQTNNSCSNNSSSNSSNNSSNSSSSSSNNSGSTPGLGAATAVLDLDTTAMVDDPAVKKTVRFDRVTVYLFERTQGFTSVPTQGGSTLGMGSTHQDLEEYSVEDHAKRRRAQPRPTSSASDAGAPVVVPISTKRRRELLRRSGVRDIDALEKDECQSIRASRERCGCACQGRCEPMFCLCVLAGIPCQVEVFSQVDRSSFPCGCTQDGCDNPNGRSEFDPVKVKAHVQQTRQRANRELGLPDEQIEPMQCLLENPPCEFFNGEGSDNSSVCSENSDYASSDETPQAAPGEAAPSLSMELEPTSAAAANNNDNNSTSNGTTVQEASEGGMDSDTASINNTASS